MVNLPTAHPGHRKRRRVGENYIKSGARSGGSSKAPKMAGRLLASAAELNDMRGRCSVVFFVEYIFVVFVLKFILNKRIPDDIEIT